MKAKRQPHRTILRLEGLEDRYLLSAGVLDPTFGAGGSVTTSFANGSGSTTKTGNQMMVEADALAIQPDGKIVAAGSSEIINSLNVGYFDLARYNPDGSLDAGFGSKGQVTTQIGARGFASAVTLQPDGKILVAGLSETKAGDAFIIVRCNSDGSLDKTFGKGGTVTTIIAQGSMALSLDMETVNGVTKIVATGDVYLSSTNQWAIGLARYNLDGSLDTSFGSAGEVLTNITTSASEGQGSLVQGDGKIVIAGTLVIPGSGAEFALARFDTSGRFDTTFGSGGVVYTAIGINAVGDSSAHADAVALQSNGDIVAAGRSSGSEFTLARYTPSGSLDPTFGTSGVVVTSQASWLNGLAIQPTDGKIIAVGGTAGGDANYGSWLVRYNPDGSLDVTFGTGGIVNPTFGQGDTAVALQSDGKIMVTAVNNGNFGLARYLPSEPEIASFTANPNPVAAGSSLTLTVSNITDANPGVTITQVTFYYFDSSGAKHVLGNGSQTSPGVWTLTFTVNLASGTYALYAQAEDIYSVFGDPVALTLTVQ
jgi:uncharacterized delta-60 repeat protein